MDVPVLLHRKRNFETALEQFNEKDQVEVVWKS